jgi:hypothetical protein
VLVSDGGGVFRAKQALAIYDRWQITKEQIDKRQAWRDGSRLLFPTQSPWTPGTHNDGSLLKNSFTWVEYASTATHKVHPTYSSR